MLLLLLEFELSQSCDVTERLHGRSSSLTQERLVNYTAVRPYYLCAYIVMHSCRLHESRYHNVTAFVYRLIHRVP